MEELGLDDPDAAAVEAASFPAERVEPYVSILRERMGDYEQLEPWPVVEPLFYPRVFLAALPHVRAYHAVRGIPDGVARATLADLGRVMRIYREANGAPGLDEQNWLTLHWRGALFELGRLQFERRGGGDLGLHIPGGAPLDPAAVDASLGQARPFFDRHFPEERHRTATCTSWLLDPQLAEALPPDSNIVGFQRRFELLGVPQPGDEDVFKFVFRRDDPPLDELPQRTTLERALVSHLRAGGHWRVRTGRLRI